MIGRVWCWMIRRIGGEHRWTKVGQPKGTKMCVRCRHKHTPKKRSLIGAGARP